MSSHHARTIPVAHGSYGQYRNELAHALAELVTHPGESQLSTRDTVRVLGFRDLLLTSLTSTCDEVLAGAPGTDRSMAAVAAAPARALRATLHALPHATESVAPSVLFATMPRDPYVRLWRTAARTSLLAADTLATGQPTSWRTHPDTAWAVMADTTAAVHALAVLDRHLATHPRLEITDAARAALQASWRTGLRLVASEVSRIAHTQPLTPRADPVTRPPRLSPFPVTGPASLLAGYQHTHRLLEARGGILPIKTLGHVLPRPASPTPSPTTATGCTSTAAPTETTSPSCGVSTPKPPKPYSPTGVRSPDSAKPCITRYSPRSERCTGPCTVSPRAEVGNTWSARSQQSCCPPPTRPSTPSPPASNAPLPATSTSLPTTAPPRPPKSACNGSPPDAPPTSTPCSPPPEHFKQHPTRSSTNPVPNNDHPLLHDRR